MNRKKNTGRKLRKTIPHPHRRLLYTDTTAWCDSRGRFAAGIIEAEG